MIITLSTFIMIGPKIDAKLSTDILFLDCSSEILTHYRHDTMYNIIIIIIIIIIMRKFI